MTKTLDFSEKIPVRPEVDVLVAGGGVAGAAAALAAVRSGKKTMLLEKTILLGGLGTIGLVNYFEPLCNGRGKQVIFGMAEEFLKLSLELGYSSLSEDWRHGEPKEPTAARYTNHYSPEIFALQLFELLQKEGVQVYYDCLVSGPVMEGNHCKGLIVDSKSGREFIPAKVVIDTTGDADILYRAGVPTIQGQNFFTYYAKGITLDSCKKAAETGNIRNAIMHFYGGRASLYGDNHPKGMKTFTGTDLDDVNDYLCKNQLCLLENLRKSDRDSRDVVTLPMMCQFRSTRHLDGDYTLVEEDHYRHFDDSIAAISDFDRRDYLYEVPYRTICKRGYDNLLTGGRSASASGYGWDVIRVIPPAIILGQAAGYAASIAIDHKTAVPEISVAELQKKLTDNNSSVHFDDALIPKDFKA